MSSPSSREDCESLLLDLAHNRDLKRDDPDAFRAKVDLAWDEVQRQAKTRSHGRAINAAVRLAGTHLPDRAAAIRRLRLANGTPLKFFREPSNPHDPNAVRVLTAKGGFFGFGPGAFIGYVPRDMAARMAPRMDRGVRFEGVIEDYEDQFDEVEIAFRVRQLS